MAFTAVGNHRSRGEGYIVMSDTVIDLNSTRAKKARLARRIGSLGFKSLLLIVLLTSGAAIALGITHHGRPAWLALAVALFGSLLALWYKRDLAVLPADGNGLTDQLSGDVLARLNPKQPLTPQALWDSLSSHWQVRFIASHLFIPPQIISTALATDTQDIAPVWSEAGRLAQATHGQTIEPGHVATALLLLSPNLKPVLTSLKLQATDIEAVALWLGRALDVMRADKPYFGGIGRDWANGFTPQLNRFGHNISLDIEKGGHYFGWLTAAPGVLSMKNAFSQGSSALALVGEDGIGKTSHVYALAQLLLQERSDRNLEHRQIVELNPSVLLSAAGQPGEMERIVIHLLNETASAGHIILFFDDAQQFFGSGTGEFDITQILMSVVQSQAVQMVLAMNPHDYQQLRSSRSAFANLLTPVVLTEPTEDSVMRVLEDAALGLEYKHHMLITYDGLREAYRLSGRYEDNLAYPGKAIQLITQALAHAVDGVVGAQSVQQTIEQTRGVKVGAAAAAETDTLLNLEDKIHERMINQTQAVSAVASALRRARAGVANPGRPFGSFLFLGPTGVGKTELAKALAATYFGAESNMIRLDMSEYQQPEDVDRLLSDGQQETKSLILAARQQPFSVILLDEIEKSHPNVLNLLLQLLDEGQLTDTAGRPVSFKDCIIIATSNAGAQTIRERVEKGESLESFQPQLLDELINAGQFKSELLNRFDEIVIFRPLTQDELAQVAQLMVGEINQTLAKQNISVRLTPAAIKKIVAEGYDPRLGARPMRRALERAVEDVVAQKILRSEAKPGDQVELDAKDLSVSKAD